MKLKDLREYEILYEVDAFSPGMVAIFLPDLPHRVRTIFNFDGLSKTLS